MCNCRFSEENPKILEHNHWTNKYRGAACKSCNAKEGKSKRVPVIFHNGSRYDFHFLIEELLKYKDKYNKVEILAKDSENYISISYGNYYTNLVFLDSYRFMSSSLDNISKGMKDEDFKIMKKKELFN